MSASGRTARRASAFALAMARARAGGLDRGVERTADQSPHGSTSRGIAERCRGGRLQRGRRVHGEAVTEHKSQFTISDNRLRVFRLIITLIGHKLKSSQSHYATLANVPYCLMTSVAWKERSSPPPIVLTDELPIFRFWRETSNWRAIAYASIMLA
jgi:hypothetical protein